MADVSNGMTFELRVEADEAKKESDKLQASLSELAKTFGRVKKSAGSIDIERKLAQSKNPIKQANQWLTAYGKKWDEINKKKEAAFAVGNIKNQTKYNNQLKDLEKRGGELYRGIKESDAIKAQNKENKKLYSQATKELLMLQKDRALQLQKQQDQSDKQSINSIIERERDLVSEQAAAFNEEALKSSLSNKSAAESASVFQTVDIKRTEDAKNALDKFMSSLDPINKKMEVLKTKLAQYKEDYKTTFMGGGNTKEAENGIKRVTKQMEKLSKSTKKSSTFWERLVNRIKSISIYRAIRSGIRWITQGVQEGLNNLSQYNQSTNETMTKLNASLNQVRNTLAISFGSVLESLLPVIQSVSAGLVDIINSFNLALAKSRGEDVYTKAKAHAEDYARSVNKVKKLSIDTFEVLSGSDEASPFELFEEGNVQEDTNALSSTFNSIFTVISKIGEAAGKLFERLISSGILDRVVQLVSNIASVISDIIVDLVDSGAMDSIINFVTGVATIVGEILRVVGNIISKLAETGALKPLLLGIASAFLIIKAAAIEAAIANAAAWVMAHPIAGSALLLAGVGTLGFVIASLLSSISSAQSAQQRVEKLQGFANGGFSTANFIATNENGKREWIGRHTSATAVVNDTQMNDIMYQAVRDGCYQGILQAMYENPTSTSGDGQITIVLDKDVIGRAVAESSGFRNEINRRNTALNLR